MNLSNWDVSNVTNFDAMFNNTISFNENISSWNTINATTWSNFRDDSALLESNTPIKFR